MQASSVTLQINWRNALHSLVGEPSPEAFESRLGRKVLWTIVAGQDIAWINSGTLNTEKIFLHLLISFHTPLSPFIATT